ncbi:MAG TPA: hypothetical protein VD815_04635 [Candidatus Saccharimonadales bacterium]|nr:hypothetical protein [Candidatus Saccharimonadales bacterium]
MEQVNQEKAHVSYYPMDAIQNRWIILLIQPINDSYTDNNSVN